MLKKILVAYDASLQSEKAFAFALDLAEKFQAQLMILSVARLPEPAVAVETEAIIDSARRYFHERFEILKTKAASMTPNLLFEVRVGHPAEQIVLCAEETGADMIVMGHRGESFYQRWLLGSVAKRVLSYARCVVTVVR